jgi:hypothetical protein
MLSRNDLLSSSRQDKNAGNSGDLVKHSAYLSLLEVLSQRGTRAQIVEAHGGKGVYASGHWQLREARGALGYLDSVLGREQASCFSPPPSGLGSVAGLDPRDIAYAGSGALHAVAVADGRAESLELLDSDPGVRAIASRLFLEECLAEVRGRLSTTDPSGLSEPVMLDRCRAGAFGPATLLHLDPFAFVMSADDTKMRGCYGDLIRACDASVRQGELAAATLFFTWGSNSAAAKDDLFGRGFRGGLENGFQELIAAVSPEQRIVISWCWEYYFAQLCVLPAASRDEMIRKVTAETDWLRPLMLHLRIQ